MHFQEYAVPVALKSFSTSTHNIPDDLVRVESGSVALVNLMPLHPFQYPFHGIIKSILDESDGILTNMQQNYHIPKIILIVSKAMKVFYKNYVGEDVPIVVKQPLYPLREHTFKAAIGFPEAQHINWFDFLCMLLKTAGRKIEGIPLSVTKFETDERFITFIPRNMHVGEIIEAIGVSRPDDYQYTDHPFTGVLMKQDTSMTEIRPRELLILPKNNKMKEPLWHKVRRLVFHPSVHSLTNLYSTVPLAFGNPCQKCLRCSLVCPVDLQPFLLSAFAKKERSTDAASFNISRCVECGLCTYICPSGIPLTRNIGTFKKEIV
jgi:ferredoxin